MVSQEVLICYPEPDPEFNSGSTISEPGKSLILLDAESMLNRVQHKVQHDIFSVFRLFTNSSKLNC